MSNQLQEKIKPLDPRKVKIALITLGWTQARLANEVEASLTATNLTINHNTFPKITTRIRKKLNL